MSLQVGSAPRGPGLYPSAVWNRACAQPLSPGTKGSSALSRPALPSGKGTDRLEREVGLLAPGCGSSSSGCRHCPLARNPARPPLAPWGGSGAGPGSGGTGWGVKAAMLDCRAVAGGCGLIPPHPLVWPNQAVLGPGCDPWVLPQAKGRTLRARDTHSLSHTHTRRLPPAGPDTPVIHIPSLALGCRHQVLRLSTTPTPGRSHPFAERPHCVQCREGPLCPHLQLCSDDRSTSDPVACTQSPA